jgi:hypothetical protein
MRTLVFALAALLGLATAAADSIREADVSPTGQWVAMHRDVGGKRIIAVFDLKSDAPPKTLDVSDRDVIAVDWLATGHFGIRTRTAGPAEQPGQKQLADAEFFDPRTGEQTVRGRELTFTALFAVDPMTMKGVQLLGDEPRLGVATRNDVVRTAAPDGASVFMHAPIREEKIEFYGMREQRGRPSEAREVRRVLSKSALWRVSLNTGKGEPVYIGQRETRYFAVAPDGRLIARLDIDPDTDDFKIFSYLTGQPQKVFDEKRKREEFWIAGPTADGKGLNVIDSFEPGRRSLRVLDLATGAFGPDLRNDLDGAHPILDGATERLLGFSLKDGTTLWLEPKLAEAEKRLASAFADVRIASWSGDFTKVTARVTPAGQAPQWALYDAVANRVDPLGPASIKDAAAPAGR